MIIENATFLALAHTKKQRAEFPTNCRCGVWASIGQQGTVSLYLWRTDVALKFAEINFSDSSEMRALAKLLSTTADAQDAQNAPDPSTADGKA